MIKAGTLRSNLHNQLWAGSSTYFIWTPDGVHQDVWLSVMTSIIEGFQKSILQDGLVELPIHPPLNLGCIANPIPAHTAPQHQIPTSKLNCHLHQPITQALSHIVPRIFPTI